MTFFFFFLITQIHTVWEKRVVFGRQAGASERKKVKKWLRPQWWLGKKRKCGDSLWTTEGWLEKIPMHCKTSTSCFPASTAGMNFSSQAHVLTACLEIPPWWPGWENQKQRGCLMQHVASLGTKCAVLYRLFVSVCAIVQRFLGFPRIVSMVRWVHLKHIVLHKAAHFNVAWIVPSTPCPLLQAHSSYVICMRDVTATMNSVQTHMAFIKQVTMLSVFGLILIRCKLL